MTKKEQLADMINLSIAMEKDLLAQQQEAEHTEKDLIDLKATIKKLQREVSYETKKK